MMASILDIAVAVLLGLGGLFGLIGSFGLLRLRDPMQRLHAPTKSTTLGVGAVLIASALVHFSWHEVLVAVFLFLTAPLSAYYLAHLILHKD